MGGRSAPHLLTPRFFFCSVSIVEFSYCLTKKKGTGLFVSRGLAFLSVKGLFFFFLMRVYFLGKSLKVRNYSWLLKLDGDRNWSVSDTCEKCSSFIAFSSFVLNVLEIFVEM